MDADTKFWQGQVDYHKEREELAWARVADLEREVQRLKDAQYCLECERKYGEGRPISCNECGHTPAYTR